MLAWIWLKGLVVYRSGRLAGVLVGVMLTVALLASIGAFVASSTGAMTQRAISDVPVDWQIQLAPGADETTVTSALKQSTTYVASVPVGYADASGFSATTGGTVQNTGSGKVLGLPSQYRQTFPAEVRPLLGSPDGVVAAQQTASNLHVTVGDQVTIERIGLPPVTVRIDGIVDLPNADSLFQLVGATAGAAPQAPPDNVLLLPAAQWHQLFDAQAAARPDTVRTQLHVRLAPDLPASDPAAALTEVQQRAHNLEARLAGGGIVADNLAARLDGVRADALYAQVLFLFLGLPGAILAALLTLAVAATGTDRRRREQALLRVRGASTAQILRIASVEGVLVAVGGTLLGLAAAFLTARVVGSADVMLAPQTRAWIVGAALAGLTLALVAVLYPAWRQASYTRVVQGRAMVRRPGKPLWQQFYLDVFVLVVAGIAFWQTASTGYKIVVAPEGVAQSSVAYQAFLAPICLWLGVGLLSLRLWESGLFHGRKPLAQVVRPVAGGLGSVVAAWLSRQRVIVTRGIVLVALSFAFATSTAVFNTTYNAQSRVDAELTNGADVTVKGSTASPPGSKLSALSAIPGVVAAQPMQHRLAYVGTDLQDLYGINASRIEEATTVSNAYVASGHARATLAALAARPDGLLLSAETARDYQLQPGDLVRLRLQNASDHQYHIVPFHFVDVVREFPTAPKDSFLVANFDYIAQQTGTDAAEIVLLRTNRDPAVVAVAARGVVSSLAGAQVSDLGATQRTISSSLTAVDLRGLTQLELAFAVLFVAGATGLILALGFAERRRAFAILTALGATKRQLGGFLWSEGLLMLVGGGVLGVALGFAVAQVLVTQLTGVFDPAPESLAVPWGYLAGLAIAAIVAIVVAVLEAGVRLRRPLVDALHEL